MKTSTLFVVGLVVGALTVFAIRAASITEDDSAASGHPDEPKHTRPEDPHAGHDMSPAPAPTPVPANQDTSGTSDAEHDETTPENLICPILGNEVDPSVYVDYKGRRIGFC